MTDALAALAILAILTPLLATTLYRIRRLEVAVAVLEARVLNGVTSRIDALDRAVFADVRRDD